MGIFRVGAPCCIGDLEIEAQLRKGGPSWRGNWAAALASCFLPVKPRALGFIRQPLGHTDLQIQDNNKNETPRAPGIRSSAKESSVPHKDWQEGHFSYLPGAETEIFSTNLSGFLLVLTLNQARETPPPLFCMHPSSTTEPIPHPSFPCCSS